jgi:MFS family permease
MLKNNQFTGMQTFILIWLGQLVSLLGTAMTRFALLIWAYQQTGEATTLALLGFFSFIPYILVSPFAGVVVDKVNRRWIMILTDLGAGIMTLSMLSLYLTGHLEIWHLYLAQAITGAFEAFQLPAYAAATTLLVPKAFYSRANGLRSLADSASQVIAPFIAGFLLILIDIHGIMWIDVATFLMAVTSLLLVRIPSPPTEPVELHQNEALWQRLSFGFNYIFRRQGLLALLLIFVGLNFFATLTYFSILPALILARTGNDELALAIVQSALGIGGVAGGLMVSFWGGPKRRIHAILAGAALSFLLGDFLFAIGHSLPVWVAAAFLAAIFIPFITSANSAIWQSKVAPQVQGRVFSVKGMLQQCSMPLGYLLAGPLADYVFEPAMAPGGAMAGMFGWLVGTGPGAGMALMFVVTSISGMAMGLSGYLFRAVRQVEDDLPDHDLILVSQPVLGDAASS